MAGKSGKRGKGAKKSKGSSKGSSKHRRKKKAEKIMHSKAKVVKPDHNANVVLPDKEVLAARASAKKAAVKKAGVKKSGSKSPAKKAEAKKADSKKADAKADPKKLFEKLKDTRDIKVSPKIVDQVMGQEAAVEVIRKAASQRRHVFLIGEPGTGKSMLGLALAELLPKEKLVDVLAFPNPNDENQPLIRTVAGGDGRELVKKAKIESMSVFKNQNIILFILAIIAMIAPWWVRSYYNSDVMFAAFFLGGMMFLAAFVIFVNLGRRAPMGKGGGAPKVIVDSFNKEQAPFLDATGAHAGVRCRGHTPLATAPGAS